MSTLPVRNHAPSTVKVIKDYSYVINDCIGKGYSSSVYRGQHDPTGQEVAIKVINMKMLKSKSHRELLNSEVECLKKTQGCRGVIEVRDVFETANNTYIVTELCEGGDLDKYLNSKKLPEKKAVELMKQIIKGYLELWKREIIHRDLKPANIFISNSMPKIADLGFAVKESEKKNNNINVGSPLYMPPESLKNNQYSYKSDIWALGVIFYEMLFGETPWKANTEKELPKKMLDIPVVKLVRSGIISNKALEFLMRTLAPQVKYRMSPQQLEEFAFEEKPDVISSSSILNQYNSKISKQKSLDHQLQPKIPQTPSSNFKIRQRKTGTIQNNTTTISPNSTQYQKKSANLTPKTESSERGSPKQLTCQFLSQIHLCRFIYKIINSLKTVLKEPQPLKDNLVKYIYNKLNTIKSMSSDTYYNVENLDEFKESLECAKIVSVCDKYMVKYDKDFGFLKSESPDKLLKKIYQNLAFTVKSLWYQIEDLTADSIEYFEEHIILVDYLMTTYLLIKLDTRSDLKSFHDKSKIEDIVQGNTHRVTNEHYKAIKDKVRQLGFV